jgi:hypothetical protein
MGYRPRMADVKQMVPGFNHNVKHRGKGYHIQTEDSGLGNPQITTHLFVGGNILATKKTSYADIVTAENLTQVVRELMEEQHKEMLRNLVNGVYDDRDEALSSQARAYQPGQLAAAAAAPASAAPPPLRPVPPARSSAPPRVDRAPPAARPAPRIAATRAHPLGGGVAAPGPSSGGLAARTRRPARAARGRSPAGRRLDRRADHRGSRRREEPRRGDPLVPGGGARPAEVKHGRGRRLRDA